VSSEGKEDPALPLNAGGFSRRRKAHVCLPLFFSLFGAQQPMRSVREHGLFSMKIEKYISLKNHPPSRESKHCLRSRGGSTFLKGMNPTVRELTFSYRVLNGKENHPPSMSKVENSTTPPVIRTSTSLLPVEGREKEGFVFSSL